MRTTLLLSPLLLGLAATPLAAQSRLAPYESAAARMAAQQPERPGQRIVGGMQAIPGSYPFQVAIIVADAPEGQEFAGFFCGGTRISERHVLTAAHCFQSKDGGDNVLASDVHVYLGQTNFRGGERIPVKSLTRHPQWNAISLANDIAVLELARAPAPETRSTVIDLAPAASPESAVMRPAPAGVRVIGWGALGQGGPSSRTLREVPLKLVDHGACLAGHTGWRERQAGSIITEIAGMVGWSKESEGKLRRVLNESSEPALGDKVICADADVGDRSPCYGDSGGPLFGEGADGKPLQLGIVSWGISCRTRDVQGVFTDVAKYRDWLRETMAK